MSAPLRELALQLYSRGLAHITPEVLMRAALRPAPGAQGAAPDALDLTFLHGQATVPLRPGGRIYVLAVGKAAAPMAAEAGRLLGDSIAAGLVVTKTGFALDGLPWPTRETGHPVPDQAGVEAAAEAEALVRQAGADDLVLVLVSGGASALLPAPLAGITLAEKQALVSLMLRTNMDIHEINTVRKAISRFKGGGLAALASPARVVGLLLSDVPGDNFSSIGSGPTVPEPVRAQDVIALLRAKGIWDDVPTTVRAVLETGDIPGKSPSVAPLNGLIGANRHLLGAMQAAAQEAGLLCEVHEAPTTGLNHEALPGLLARWEAFRERHRGLTGDGGSRRTLCLISGGETTVEVTGSGLGGRCQELAALMLPRLDADTVFLAAGSDGNDGPTDAAGGLADQETWQRVQAEALPYDALLADNDSYPLLKRAGVLIQVPPTRNNVMDVHLFLGAALEG